MNLIPGDTELLAAIVGVQWMVELKLAFIVSHGINPTTFMIFFQRNGVYIVIYVGDHPFLTISRDIDPLFIVPNEALATRLRGNLVSTVLPTDSFLEVEGCFLTIDHNVECIGIFMKANADAVGRYIVLSFTEFAGVRHDENNE